MTVRTVCPVDPRHGRVLDAPGERFSWYCPHQEHDGRPSTHALGAAPSTRSYFTTEEVERGELLPVAARPLSPVSGRPGGIPARSSRSGRASRSAQDVAGVATGSPAQTGTLAVDFPPFDGGA